MNSTGIVILVITDLRIPAFTLTVYIFVSLDVVALSSGDHPRTHTLEKMTGEILVSDGRAWRWRLTSKLLSGISVPCS